MTDLHKKRFGAKDWMSFVFSLLALVLSVFTFYVSQYQVVDDLKVRVVRSDLDATDLSFNPLCSHKRSKCGAVLSATARVESTTICGKENDD